MDLTPIRLPGLTGARPQGTVISPRPLGDPDQVAPARTLEKLGRPRPARASWLRRLARVAVWTAVGVSLAVGSLGVIGYVGNPALREQPAVSVLADQNPAANPTTAGPAPRPLPRPSMRVASDRVAVVVPGSTLSRIAGQAQQSPLARRFLQERALEAQQSLTRMLAEQEAPEGHILLDARLPLPTGERAFFHVGQVNLPSLGVNNFELREVPLVVGYRVSRLAPSLEVGLETFQSQAPPCPASVGPEGVYLGSVRVSVSPRQSSLPVEGSLSLSLDQDGSALRQQLGQLEARRKEVPTGSPRALQLDQLIARHQHLLEQGQSLPDRELVRAAFSDQKVAFKASLEAGPEALARATYHVWMGRDVTGDGRSDLHLTSENDFSQLEGLKVELQELRGLGQRPAGFLPGLVHEQVEKAFSQAIRKALPEATDSLRRAAIERLGAELERGNPWVAEQGNQALARGYAEGVGMQVPPLAGTGGKELHYGVGKVQVGAQGMLVEMGPPSKATQQEVSLPFRLQPGEVGLRLPGEELNARLRDTIDWQSLLTSMRKAQGLKELKFGPGGQPRFIYDQTSGKPAITFDIRARSEGAIFFDAKINTGVVVPLELRAQAGRLEVKPVADGVRLTNPKEPLPFDPTDLLPTRLLSNLIANIVAQSQASNSLAGQLKNGLSVSLDEKGLDFLEVHAQPRGKGAPDLAVKLRASKETSEFLLRTMLEKN